MPEERIVGFYKIKKTKTVVAVSTRDNDKNADKGFLSKNFVSAYHIETGECLTKYMLSKDDLLESLENWSELKEDEIKKLNLNFNSEPPDGYTNFTVSEDNLLAEYVRLINKCEKAIRERNYTELAILIGSESYGGKKLKNPEAEKLRIQETIEIDGEIIHLWTGHTFDSVTTQNSWNRLSKIEPLENKNFTIVVTGVFQIPRQEVVEISAKHGVQVAGSLSKKVDFLVVGTENVSPNKIVKARELGIKIINENEYLSSFSD